jgi:hypothetical protein
MVQMSAALRNALLVTGSFKAQMDSCFIYIYEGTPPATPEQAHGGTLLVKITAAAGAALNWAATAADGVVAKDASQVWESEITTSGTAQFFRICKGADDGSTTDNTKLRIQGTCGGPGSPADVILSNPVLVDNNANTQGFTIFQFQLPG